MNKITTLLVILLLTSSCFLIKGGHKLNNEDLSYRFKRLNGGYSTLEEYDNEIILLYFFTSYCIPCILDFNFIEQNANFLSENKVTIIGIGMDYNQETTLKPFVTYNKIKFPVMVADKNIMNGDWSFGKIIAVPSIIVINKKEKRYYIHSGNISRELINEIR